MKETATAQQRWFTIEDRSHSQALLTVGQADKSYWPIEVLQTHPIPTDVFAGRAVTVTGRGSAWMYAAAGVAAVLGGAATITVVLPDRPHPIHIYPFPESDGLTPPSGQPWCRVTMDPLAGTTLAILPHPDNDWPDDVLSDLPLLFGRTLDARFAHITGRGTWMYAAIAAQAVASGMELVTVITPTLGASGALVVVGANRVGELIQLPPGIVMRSSPGKALGIVGDPNCGKSVFATALDAILRTTQLSGWKLDCDGAAPTQNWYRNMLRQGRSDKAQVLRKEQKRPWSAELETSVRHQLASSKSSLDIVIADLPGGDHRTEPPRRVFEHNRRLLLDIDSFIVLGRADSDSARMWIEELSTLERGDRIVAVLETLNPDAEPGCNVTTGADGILRGTLTGLDRHQPDGALVAALHATFEPLLRQLSEEQKK